MERVSVFLLSAGIDRLVTMAYVQLYPDDTIATVALAGHPGPLVVPSDGGAPFCLPCEPGPILGVESLARWGERTVQLPEDSNLVLYTDGLVDFPQARPDELDRLLGRAAEAADGPVDALAEALIGLAPDYDDAAVLVARVTSAQPSPLVRIFPALPISAAVARTWISDLFDLWAASGAVGEEAAEQLNVAQLLLTELVSNAVRHTDESVRLCVRLTGQRLRIEVADTSERMPVLRRPEVAAAEGRGLRLVDTLSSEWGVQLDQHGKIVWFELDLSGSAEVDEEKLLAAFTLDEGPEVLAP
jgi:anti-sigma regulatory factor (Ser/Thr protein kinase)